MVVIHILHTGLGVGLEIYRAAVNHPIAATGLLVTPVGVIVFINRIKKLANHEVQQLPGFLLMLLVLGASYASQGLEHWLAHQPQNLVQYNLVGLATFVLSQLYWHGGYQRASAGLINWLSAIRDAKLAKEQATSVSVPAATAAATEAGF